jgi:hypothetical protein
MHHVSSVPDAVHQTLVLFKLLHGEHLVKRALVKAMKPLIYA